MDFSHIPAIQQQTVLEVTWTNCPNDVAQEVSDLWSIVEYGNDNYYFAWKDDAEWWMDGVQDKAVPITYAERWPKIAQYLVDNNVTECLIHYWW